MLGYAERAPCRQRERLEGGGVGRCGPEPQPGQFVRTGGGGGWGATWLTAVEMDGRGHRHRRQCRASRALFSVVLCLSLEERFFISRGILPKMTRKYRSSIPAAGEAFSSPAAASLGALLPRDRR